MKTELSFRNFHGEIDVVWWRNGDPVPTFGDAVGIDTETELITDVELTPPLVVMGVYNPADQICYLADWRNCGRLLSEILKRNVIIYLANAGFDYYELECPELREAVTEGKVIDVLVRAPLYELGTIGFIRSYNLATVCKLYLDYNMDKGKDKGDEAERLNFRRTSKPTEEQCRYLSIDCASTYYAAEVMGPQPTEVTHTKGAIVLYHLQKTGLPVDFKVYDYCEKKLSEAKEKYRQELISYGFPDPCRTKRASEIEQLKQEWPKFLEEWFAAHIKERYEYPSSMPGKAVCRKLFLYLINFMESGDEKGSMARNLAAILAKNTGQLSKTEKELFDRYSDRHPFLDACDASKKLGVWPLLLRRALETELNGGTAEEVFAVLEKEMENHPDWFAPEKTVKPTEFLQEKLKALEQANPGLAFERTEITGQLKCSKKDSWLLEDFGVKDPFLEAYNNFSHIQKYLSTYVNRSHLASDGRVRTRYGIVSTGRSNSTGPNLQQYPSHDEIWKLKNMFTPPKGMIMAMTDYSFAELVSLAQECLSNYGHSVLAEIINAGVCPHRFFAGVMEGLIPADTDFCRDPAEVDKMKEFLRAHITEEARRKCKAVNFGLPGKMSARRLLRHLRESGIKADMNDAVNLRDTWLRTFSEMQKHFNRPPMRFDPYVRYGMEDLNKTYEDDPFRKKKENRELFQVRTIVGFVRSRAIESAACNTVFQNPVAHLAKEALWNLERAGLGDRLLVFVHDEIDYWLKPAEVKLLVPVVEKLWLEPGKRIFPDVKLKCETSLSLYWDKEGVKFDEVEWDEQGCPKLEIPEFVKVISDEA